MPDAPTFSQVAPRLYLASSTGDAGLSAYWAGYFASDDAGFGTTATWDQVWQDAGGVLLFLGADLSDAGTFADAFGALLPKLSPTGLLRVAWIPNPEDPSSLWQVQRLDAEATGSGGSIAWTVARQGLFLLGGYALRVTPGVALTQADPDSLGYGLAVPASAFLFAAPGGGFTASGSSAWIPMADTGVGCWQAQLPVAASLSPDGLAQLGVLLRYATPVPQDEVAPGLAQAVDGSVESLDMPILGQGDVALTLALRFDPLNPLVPDRSQLGFFGSGFPVPPALTSTLRTTLGYTTTLTPLDAAAPLGPGRLAFGRTPLATVGSGEPGFDYYLTPDGAYTLQAASGGGSDELMLGLSGLESAILPSGGSCIAFFAAGQPAFVPEIPEAGAPTVAEALSGLGTTAWMTLVPASAGGSGLTYLAQPRQAPLFHGGDTLGGSFLEYLELPAAVLPAWQSGGDVPATLPVGAFTGLQDVAASLAQRLEASVLAPVRRSVLGLPAAGAEEDVDPSRLAVTPNGLVVEVASGDTALSGVVLANMPGSAYPQVELTEVGPSLQAALQSNQLFFVVSDVETFMGSSSVAYQLTEAEMPVLQALGVPTSVVEDLNTLLAGLDPPYPVFDTEAAFDAAISATVGDYLPQCQEVGGLLKADLEGWTFQLSPRSWRSDDLTPTLMIFKFCNRSLVELAADTASWGWPEAAETGTAGLEPTQAVLQGVLEQAAAAEPGTPLRQFYDQIAARPAWNGVLFLNAPVSISELPDDLQFMVAGIDTEQFYAHHVGFSLTPFSVEGGAPALGQTAAFGLISYVDDVDLYTNLTVPFAFKTKELTATFANAHLTGFAGQVELLTNQLFGAELTKQPTEHGNNLILDGSYQRVGGIATYSFVLSGSNLYGSPDSALESIEVLGVQLNTRRSLTVEGRLFTDFSLQGNLRFFQFQPFDPFTYGVAATAEGEPPLDGYLRFAGLVVTMQFDLATPDEQSFTVAEGQMSFDLANSSPRPHGLAAAFPLTLSGLVAQGEEGGSSPEGSSPEDLGFASVSVPLEQTPMTPPWYGLNFTLDLGTLGALAGSVGLTVNLLTAWKPGTPEQPQPLYVGLELPNAKSLGIDWPLQGILSLGFRSFEFETYEDSNHEVAYLLLLRQFALRILGLSFPPGNTDVLLFGNPDQSSTERLGWYACYAQDEEVGSGGDPSAGELVAGSGRRLPPTQPRARKRPSAQVRIDRRLRSGRRLPNHDFDPDPSRGPSQPGGE
ncbi:MAG: hemagglutinin protein [Acidobacteriota bacterium]|nr:hemagglutinin protein [Acidobacteriota bacterium]